MTSRLAALLAALWLWAFGMAALAEPARIYAEVRLNGVDTGEVLELQGDARAFAAPAQGLAALGLVVRGDKALVPLSALEGVRYTFESDTQTLDLTVAPSALQRTPSAAPAARAPPLDRPSWGGLINYAGYALVGSKGQGALSGYGELRLFGPAAVLSNTMVARTGGGGAGLQRLDTTLVLPDYARARRLEVGDFITSGLAWNRPVRAAGVSFARDFTIRPDIITQPTATVSGGAAAPSVVDVYLDGVRQSSTSTAAGPFTLSSRPTIDGQGQVNVVVTDVLGRQTEQSFAFYASSSLLRSGLSAYAFESGSVRRDYASPGDRYGLAFASASLRRGLSDAITLEAHAEAAGGLVNAGVGAVGKVREAVLVSAAISGSQASGAGSQIYLSAQRATGRYRVYLSAQQTLGRYEDLASRSGDTRILQQVQAGGSVSAGRWGTFNASFTRLQTPQYRLSAASAGWSTPLPWGANLYVSGYAVTEGHREASLTLGFTLPLNGRASASAAVTGSGRDWSASGSAASNPAPEGGWGWSVAGQAGGTTQTDLNADVRHVGDRGEQAVGGAWSGGTAWLRGYAAGTGVWLAGDRPRLARQGGQSFAVVETGSPGIGIEVNNRSVGRTGKDGRLLLTSLPGYVPSEITIDQLTVGLHEDVVTDSRRVRPVRGAGFVVNLAVRATSAAAAKMVLADGKPVPLGSVVAVDGRPSGPVGYDGATYLTGLTGAHMVEVTGEWGSCTARILYAARPGQASQLGTVTCKAQGPVKAPAEVQASP